MPETVPLLTRTAPRPPTPWPETVKGSSMLPFVAPQSKVSVAPSATVVPVEVAPSALMAVLLSVPALTWIAPV
jgi:hypothetical protein